jgi:hypothetical protein
MIDDQLFNEHCTCKSCRHVEQLHKDHPDLPWVNPHKYDYLHAEDTQTWSFKTFCRCELCHNERQRLAQRQITTHSSSEGEHDE